MNWQSFNELMIIRRHLQLVIKYRKAEPGIIRISFLSMMFKAFGQDKWYMMLDSYESFSTDYMQDQLHIVNAEIEYRLERFYLAVPY